MGTTTVLIGERFKRFLQFETSFLAHRGFEILTASDGTRAVELARARHPRLILLDLEMGTTDGATACAAMRRDPTLAFTPIVILSEADAPEERERCLKAGCTKFVVKPPKPAEVLGSIAQMLSVRQRKVARMPVVFNLIETSGGRQIVGMASDLSGTGLLLLAQRLILVGAELKLEFVIPTTNETVKVKGKVIRTSQNAEGSYEIGVHFVDLPRETQQQIVDYVSS